jgi:hypothetical protein
VPLQQEQQGPPHLWDERTHGYLNSRASQYRKPRVLLIPTLPPFVGAIVDAATDTPRTISPSRGFPTRSPHGSTAT